MQKNREVGSRKFLFEQNAEGNCT